MLNGLKITVLGLGLHGSGVAAAKYCTSQGADVTVTDLKKADVLASSLGELDGLPIRYVLGKHDINDIRNADIVIKNPAVPSKHPILHHARWIETDLSLFFRIHRPHIIAITGSKGKSSCAAAIFHVLSKIHKKSKLGGNIGISPLCFHHEELTHLVLELSSFQIEDLYRVASQGISTELPEAFRAPLHLHMAVAGITNIYPDHLNSYANMDAYVAAKQLLFQGDHGCGVYNFNDPYCRSIAEKSTQKVRFFSTRPTKDPRVIAWIKDDEVYLQGRKIPHEGFLASPRSISRFTACNAAASLSCYGISHAHISEALPTFKGLPHRMEYLGTWRKVNFYNDTASTIPHATLASIEGIPAPIILIMGGANKSLDFSPLLSIAKKVAQLILLEGSASSIMALELNAAKIPFHGPFSSLEKAFQAACHMAKADNTIIFSPAATSFEMYQHEFERGEHFRQLFQALRDR